MLLRNDWASSPEGCFVAVNAEGDVVSECVAFLVHLGRGEVLTRINTHLNTPKNPTQEYR